MNNRPGLLSRLVSHTLLIITFFSAIWLGLCFAASHISAIQVPYLAMFSLTTPFAVAANIFFIFFWLLVGKAVRLLLPLLSLVLCYKVVFTLFGFNFNDTNNFSKDAQTIKIMSWNVHGVGLFERLHNNTASGIMSVIKKEDPDILFMAEYPVQMDDSTKPFSNIIMYNNSFETYRYCPDNTLGKKIFLGNVLFSKYPILHYTTIHLGRSIYMQQCDLQLPGDKTIRFFFVHLYSFNLSDNDRRYFSEVRAKRRIGRTDLHYSRFYISLFNYSYAERAAEADTIARLISQSPYPVFICGDFNDLPGSYTYTTIRGKLLDAFLEKGFGFGRTYNELFFTLRIDHMLYDPVYLKIRSFKAPQRHLSDHNPVIANFEVE